MRATVKHADKPDGRTETARSILSYILNISLGGRNAVHLPENLRRMKTIAIQGLSLIRETLLSLGGKLIQKLANAQVLNKATVL